MSWPEIEPRRSDYESSILTTRLWRPAVSSLENNEGNVMTDGQKTKQPHTHTQQQTRNMEHGTKIIPWVVF